VNSTSKTTMERAHKKIQKLNKERKQEQDALIAQQVTMEP